MKINNISTISFQKKYTEAQIISSFKSFIEKYQNMQIVKNNDAYFQDILKGSNIDPLRKTEIDLWIKSKVEQYKNFDVDREIALAREYIEKSDNSKGKFKKILNKTKKIFVKDKILSNPIMIKVIEQGKDAEIFRLFLDFFNSYLELIPNKKLEGDVVSNSTGVFSNIETIQNFKFGKKEQVINSSEKKLDIENPKRLINISENEAKKLLEQYREIMSYRRTFKPIQEQTKAEREANLEYNRTVYLPIVEKIKSHNISVIEKKEFSLDPSEQVAEKYNYIHYEIIPNAYFNESSCYDALEMFDRYGKREEYQKTGVSTLCELKNCLIKVPTEASVTKLIKLFGKHAGDFMYPDERSGDINSISYATNYMILAQEARTVDQARLVLENGRRIFWNDKHINKLANVWMVDKNAPFKGNKEVEKIIDEMFEVAEKNREPFKDCKYLQHEIATWYVSKDYKCR